MNNKTSTVSAYFSRIALKTADAGDGDTLFSLPNSALSQIQAQLDVMNLPVCSRSSVGETVGELRRTPDEKRLYLYSNPRTETLRAVFGTGTLADDMEMGKSVYPDTVLFQVGNPILKNSMTYVLRLSDGSFILIDGGIETDDVALNQILDELDPLSAHHRIRAWILTHSHHDHVTVFNHAAVRFAPEAVYLNFPTPEETERRDPNAVIQNRMVRETLDILLKNNCRVYKPYPGQQFTVGNLRFEVLYAQSEWTLSEDMTTVNDASLVLKLHAPNGKTILFLADVMAPAGKILESFYSAETLKSDAVQVAHHSMYGPDFPLYDKIAPSVCFWPVSASEYDLYGKDLPRNRKLRSLNIPHYISHKGNAALSL